MILKLLLIQSILFTEAFAFNGLQVPRRSTIATTAKPTSSLFPQPRQRRTESSLVLSSAALSPSIAKDNDGGFLSFKTKFGYLNPFAIYYGVTAILLGIPWFIALNISQLFYKITGDKMDKLRRLPIAISQMWGVALLRLTRSYPEVENKEIIDNLTKE